MKKNLQTIYLRVDSSSKSLTKRALAQLLLKIIYFFEGPSSKEQVTNELSGILGTSINPDRINDAFELLKTDGKITEEHDKYSIVQSKREKIEIESVKDARIATKGIGYVHIADFQENTTQQMSTALSKLDKEGLKALIIDLRDNGGGLLEQAVDLSGLFLAKGQKVVSVKSKIKEQQKDHFTSGKYKARKEPMVILVNGRLQILAEAR